MKFTNVYGLTKLLFKEGIFAVVDLYIRGEFVFDAKVKDAKLLDILHKIWSEWEWVAKEEFSACDRSEAWFIPSKPRRRQY